MSTAEKITVETTIHAPIEKVWEYFNNPEHIIKWNSASEDWHTPKAENDLRAGGSFSYRMEAKDGSFGFDFGGIYDTVDTHKYIAYTLGHNRKVSITFEKKGDNIHVSETFEAEHQNPIEMQKGGWQMIINNFKKHVESN
jgi:uncharacterized protein YndB with AHSA1/START domain